MEQISIIERFPYPFQVSFHCTTLPGSRSCWEGPTGAWGQAWHHCPGARCHSAAWRHSAAVHTAWDSQVSLFEPRTSSV